MPRIVAAEHGPLELITGVSIVPQDSIDDIEQPDIVFVPNVIVLTPEEIYALDRRLIAWVAKMHRQGTLICSACGGSLVLAAAGLLSGRETTTHWSHVPVFRREFPDVRLHEDRILVQTGDGHSIISCGGASSWQNLALLLIDRYGSGEEAIRISRFSSLPVAPRRTTPLCLDGGQCRPRRRPRPQVPYLACGELRSRRCHRRGGARIGLSQAHVRPPVQGATGYSPLAYVQALRIEEAKQMLETGSAPVDGDPGVQHHDGGA